ncbi:MAG: GNAT family N-acetyltransferase [Eubacterium sp.]|nr:GNAT family N-acetyltransferase [Eubacterium sp.]
MNYSFKTERLRVVTSESVIPKELLRYYSENRSFFERYEPKQPDGFYTLQSMKDTLSFEADKILYRQSMYYYFYLKEEPEAILGTISFVRFRPLPYANVVFGYDLHKDFQGHGYATEACRGSIDKVLSMFNLHRIETRVATDNEKSINILKRLGFSYEGLEKSSIYLEGQFKDHYRYAFINEKYKTAD